ncbi:uncharacterized protein LOC105381764 [Plutella xylostella]|uniref:uncharacterized protein LOC105381764 n=1 Tax=Plutella xylostella TaxID=51655 RepID=UPI002032AB2D|nr:uncharacterized protein LOC105381764 [Plutella xylostella]
MFDRIKQCKHRIMIRQHNFLFVFNLRQGTILIAVHQIALALFVLLVLAAGAAHAAGAAGALQADMADAEERRELDLLLRDHAPGSFPLPNNQRRFRDAEHRATVSLAALQWAGALAALQLLGGLLLLYGGVRARAGPLLAWLLLALPAAPALLAALYAGSQYPCLLYLFGGPLSYHVVGALLMATLLYAICTVGSYVVQLRAGAGGGARGAGAGERLVLLDHAARASLVSAAHLAKLSHAPATHFV